MGDSKMLWALETGWKERHWNKSLENMPCPGVYQLGFFWLQQSVLATMNKCNLVGRQLSPQNSKKARESYLEIDASGSQASQDRTVFNTLQLCYMNSTCIISVSSQDANSMREGRCLAVSINLYKPIMEKKIWVLLGSGEIFVSQP